MNEPHPQTPQSPDATVTIKSHQGQATITHLTSFPDRNTPKSSQNSNMRPEGPRDTVVGPDSGPAPPFPLKLNGEVVKGFGRGSKEVC